MIRTSLLTLIVLLIPLLASAEKPPQSQDTAALEDLQDLVYFARQRPVLLRLHLEIDGRPFRSAWNDYWTTWFAFFDRDANGSLSKSEVEPRLPRAQSLRDWLRSGTLEAAPGSVKLAQLDTQPVDRKVSRDEFARYFRKFGVAALQVSYGINANRTADPLTEALFDHLDTNKDGKLSHDELLHAFDALRSLDTNEDELISPQELLPDQAGNEPMPMQDRMAMDAGGQTAYLPEDAAFALLTPGEGWGHLADQLLSRYDHDGNKHLSRAEIGLDKAVFDAIDRNHDGQLDAVELAAMLALAPDVELTIRLASPASQTGLTNLNAVRALFDLGRSLGKRSAITIVHTNASTALAPVVRTAADGSVILTLEGTQLTLAAVEGAPKTFAATRQTLLQQFEQADANKDGQVDTTEAQGQKLQALRNLLALHGGVLSRQELTAFLELHARGVASAALLSMSDQGQNLFAALDADHDGQLGQRELRAAWSRMAAWDRDGDGQISRHEIPRKLGITLSQGQPSGNGNAVLAIPAPGTQARSKAAGRGPLWFRRMDRNGDGDVSPREFLGTPEEFKRIDTDGDGLIDADEAERADALFRQKRSGRPSP